MSAILDALSDVGYALDTPGALARGLLAGRPGSRASGEELLDAYGLPGGPLGGFAAEMVLDPLALAGPAFGAFKGLRGLSHADDLAPLARRLGELGGAGGAAPDALDALRASYRGTVGRPSPVADAIGRFVDDEEGALRPFLEIGRRTDPDYINSVPWFHGSGTPGLSAATLDPMKTDPSGLFGRGIYTTADPTIAGGGLDSVGGSLGGLGADSYAVARAREGRARWGGEAGTALRGLFRGGDPRASALLDDLVRLRSAGAAEGADPLLLDHLRNVPGAARPGSEVASVFEMAGPVPKLGARLGEIAGRHGIDLPPYPRPVLYRADTNLGKIADLDLPAEPGIVEAIRGMATAGNDPFMAEHLDRVLGAGDVLNSDLIQKFRPTEFYGGEIPGEPDLLIRALREAGYDALSHTGGLRAGGGRGLHQVLIALDPNDTVSRVGRAGQVRSFDEVNPEELLRLLGGGA